MIIGKEERKFYIIMKRLECILTVGCIDLRRVSQ